MKISAKKRFLTWVIAFLMVFTYVPATAYATDVVSVTPDAEAAVIDAEADIVEEDAATAETTEEAVQEEEPATEVKDAEDEIVKSEKTVNVIEDVATFNVATTNITEDAVYEDIPVLGGDVLVYNSKGTGTEADENGIVTILAAGAKTTVPSPNNITVYNCTEYAATLSFDYSASNYSEFSEGNATGTFTETLEAGKGANLSIRGDVGEVTAILTLSDFKLEPVPEASIVEFEYDDTYGNITVAGEAVAVNGTKDIYFGEGSELIATPKNGADFIGWIDVANNKILSRESTYTLKPIKDMLVEAVFAGESSDGYYMAGENYLFDDLTAAAEKAANIKNKTVVLMNDAILTGKHTIPANVTLLIPFDDANTVYTKEPVGEKTGYVKPTAYRTLKMAAGAEIIVNGTLSVSAKHHAAVSGTSGGAPTGDVSYIVMAKGSSITINEKAALYAYGYITGEGDVTAEDGAVVYEYFQFEDWRGGNASLGIANNMDKGVFPMSQYYVQNIEVPLTLKAGASEFVYTSVNIGGTSIVGAAVEFMGSDAAMFNLKKGAVIKSYDGATDRLNIVADGEMSLSPISVTMSGNTIDCADFELPINGNITVEMNSGDAVIDQDIALLPGSEIIIGENATCTLSTGVGIYTYDLDQWGGYCGTANKKLVPINYAPGKKYNRTEADLVDAKVLVNGELDASAGYIYSTVSTEIVDENEIVTSGGANITSEGNGVIVTKSIIPQYTYQYVQKDTEGEFKAIRVFPAFLANADGSHVQTWDLKEAGTYTYEDGKWVCNHAAKTETVKTVAGCETTGIKVISCDLDKDYHNYSYEVEIPATGHDKVTDKAVAVTCTTDGKTEGSHCKTCGVTLVAQETIRAEGHKEVVDKAIAATCVTDGLTEGRHCTVCDWREAQVVVPATGHDWVVEGKAPTCTEDGYGSSKCKNCNEEIKGDTIPATGHKYEWTETKAPTCTAAGERAGVCQNADCGHKTTEPIAVVDHVFKDYAVTKAAACEAAGEKTAKCENCDATDVKEIAATGHTWKTDMEGQPLYEQVKAPTCTEKGSEAVHCEDCDATDAVKEIAALGHTDVVIKEVKPTCDAEGSTAGTKCSVCGITTKEPEVVPSYGGHKWDKGTVTQIPRMVKNPDTSAKLGVIYESGSRYFACQNEGCKESKTEKVDWGEIKTYDEFIENLAILEDWAFEYAVKNNIEDPAALVIRYVRTGVDRYNSGSWEIMAGVDNSDFTDWVTKKELEINDKAATDAEKVNVTGLKNISNFTMVNGEYVDFGHMFGTIDISYTNPTSINHADVAGFFGDTTDLLSTADRFDVRGTVLEMTAEITEKYFCVPNMNWDDKFGKTDMLGDLDGYYLNRELLALDYAKGDLTKLCKEYFTKDLTEEFRAEYYLTNRLQCGTSKAAVRNAVYMAYTGNSVISTLEGTREFKASAEDLADMRKAACYVVADYICKLAGDWTADIDNPYFTVQSEEFYNLAPGITQESKKAVMHTVKDGKPVDYDMEYYIATVDITRDDVNIYANYPGRPLEKDANGNYNWSRMTVLEQAQQAQETYGNPDSPLYEENYNVIVSTNAEGFDMTGSIPEERGEPGGLLIMDGEKVHDIGSNGFFGITKDGKAVMGTTAEYNAMYADKLDEAVGGFGTLMIRDGKITVNESSRGNNAPRTAIGVTASGKVVMMVLDGRQQRSEGGDMLEIAHILLDAGCVNAINLDGGGSSTYVAKMPGDDELSLVNHPSDGYPRAIGSSLLAVSTAKSSTVFDHADLKAATSYMTVGSVLQMTADGVTSTGNAVDVPANATWSVSNDKIAKIDANGNLTALRTGTVDVNLMLDGVSVGQKRIYVVVPDTVTFTKGTVDVVYESKVTLPIKAYYEGKAVTVNANDFDFVIGNAAAGKMDGLDFAAGTSASGLKKVEITANIKGTSSEGAKITVRLYNQGEGTFDFDKKTGGNREFAWLRTVSNADTADNSTYYAVDKNKDMEIGYTFAIDMTEIPIPEVLEELTDMLPGSNVEGACAWTYLCNLAQRISDTTEVKATVKIDDNYKLVDVNKIDVKNEYFKLTKENGVVYDEKTNTVTLTLNWVRQYAPIDLEMADPLCMVTGIRLVPKADADWGENKTLNIINQGEISYDVYMRASSLYTFCNDKSNQEKYGLKPFSRTYIDKDGVERSEAGGGFGSTYRTFTDSFTLVNAVKNGWIVENGSWTYYKDGSKLTGIQQITERVDGVMTALYYDFGETGNIKEQTPYTGMVTEFGLTGKSYSYAVKGVLTGGWVQIGDDWHYFDPATKKALSGKQAITVTARGQSSALGQAPVTITETVTYELDETGKVLNGGTWFVNAEGKTYFYYGPGFLTRQWGEKDGHKVYFAMTGHLLRGIVRIKEDSNRPDMYYMFDEETGYFIQKCEGFVEYKGSILYYPTEEERMAGLWPEDVQDWAAEGDVLKYGRAMGLQKIDGKYYLFKQYDKETQTGYGGMLVGKQKVEHGIEGACTTITFASKDKGGYAIDINGNPRTDLKHVIVETPAVAATCSKSGLTAGTHCQECGEVFVAQNVVPATGKHTWEAAKTVDKTATTKRAGIKSVHCTDCDAKKAGSTVTIPRIKKITAATVVYNGKIKNSNVTVVNYKGKKLVKGKDFTVTYKNSKGTKVVTPKNVGSYKAVVKFKGDYKGTFTRTFKINPKATVINKLTKPAKKQIKVTWKKQTAQVTGYQISYATNKKMNKAKIVTVKGYNKNSKVIKKLKAKKKYWVQVRTYKVVNGKKYTSAWSAKKIVTTK